MTSADTGTTTRARRLEAFATGAWLAGAQVCLSFSLLYGAGMSPLIFFGLILSWLFGSCIGVLVGSSRAALILQIASLLSYAAAEYMLINLTFSPASTAIGILAGLACGAYAGSFFRDRSQRFSSFASLLLWENNGFIAGYLAASIVLFSSIKIVAVCALGAGVAVLVMRLALDRIWQTKTA